MGRVSGHGGTGTSTAPVGEDLWLPGGRIHLLRGGTGPALLFLPPAAGVGRWYEFYELLAEEFEVFVVAPPGCGGSEELTGTDAPDLGTHYLDLLERLDLGRPHLAGASSGGWLAAELAAAAPDAIGALVLLSPTGLWLPDDPIADLSLLTRQQIMDVLFHDPDTAALQPAGSGIDVLAGTVPYPSGAAGYGLGRYLCDPGLERRLSRITAPTLVIWAADDLVVPINHGYRYSSRIRGAQFTRVANCGHATYLERPDAFAEIIADFLDEASIRDNFIDVAASWRP